MLTYIAPVLRVAGLAGAVAYYRDLLGFEVNFEYQNLYAEVHRDGCRIHFRCTPPSPRDQAAFERDERLDVCSVVVDAAKLHSGYAKAGVTFSVALRRMPYGTEF